MKNRGVILEHLFPAASVRGKEKGPDLADCPGCPLRGNPESSDLSGGAVLPGIADLPQTLAKGPGRFRAGVVCGPLGHYRAALPGPEHPAPGGL